MNKKLQNILDDIERSAKTVKVLPQEEQRKKALHEQYSINPESLLGTVLENTGGVVIENWLRFYGCGELDFVERNQLVPLSDPVFAEDILGGLFLRLDSGNIGYFAPDSLAIEDMEIGLGQFLYWCLHGDTEMFYADHRWEGWRGETAGLRSDEGVAFYPFLWAKAESLESRRRSVVPMKEIIGLEFDFLRQMQN